ncbi:glycosyltransferase family 2 protein [Paracoccus sp. MBLB3053]|uniref:Glycosyltransferase family 2 protein n=1 Tax=Paracoccus aurantius TaxID=3073814 RepID=A0ABU2HMS8_9RHOB|nr:glycosyltransferase family 2 protein [Paracoccus sp. MBLB3053]MDS9466343.1 glycosyltransferase family 2 protein [Paracoccus sp. MBLB3053]
MEHLGAAVSPQGVVAIAIGRNEGERLVRCLRSLLPQVDRVIYVDSGSTDGSAERAAELGAEIVRLDMSLPFTAARARNAGLNRAGDAEFVQFVDGDCEVDGEWIATALAALSANENLAIVAGRRRELHPESSIYNRLCDAEWDTPIGPAQAVGGDMLARHVALREIGGFDPTLIAGEEPEMCLRIARAGWGIHRLDAPMTLHDAAMTRFGQWAQRSRRAGHAFAEVSWRYRDGPEGFWRRETLRSVFWAVLLPLVILLGAMMTPWSWALLLIYPAQVIRLAMRDPDDTDRWSHALYSLLGKFPEARGVIEFHLRRLIGRRSGLIEYK